MNRKRNNTNDFLQVKDIVKELSVSREKLKFYERKGLIRPDRRTSSGYRLYKPEVITRLRLIHGIQSLGFTLKEIKTLLGSSHSDRASWIDLAKKKRGAIQEKITALKQIQNTLQEYINDPGAWEKDEACVHFFEILKRGNVSTA